MRHKERMCTAVGGLLSILGSATLVAYQGDLGRLRSITVQDCVRTRRVVDQEAQISPDGSLLAYVVKAPNVVTNENDYQLYVRDLKQLRERENGHLLLQSHSISGIRWLNSRKIIARIENEVGNKEDSATRLCTVDTSTGELETLKLPQRIQNIVLAPMVRQSFSQSKLQHIRRLPLNI